jgi:hypothetical protein
MRIFECPGGATGATIQRMSNQFAVMRYGGGPDDIAVPVIDGVPLFERLPGRYPGLAVRTVTPPSRQWLGAPVYEEDGRAVILDGTCGVAGCCGVMATIEVGPDTVLWHDFYALGGPDLPSDLRFVFVRWKYEKVLASIVRAPRVAWRRGR